MPFFIKKTQQKNIFVGGVGVGGGWGGCAVVTKKMRAVLNITTFFITRVSYFTAPLLVLFSYIKMDFLDCPCGYQMNYQQKIEE